MTVFTALVCYVILDYLDLHPSEFPGTIAVHSLLGIVLGLFLVLTARMTVGGREEECGEVL
jgi:putative membrane protein